MRKTARVKLEIRNSRYVDRDLKERLSELILYSKYAGIDLSHFHKAIAEATLIQGHEGPEMGYGGKLLLTTDYDTLTLINKLIEMYPVFSTWDIKFSEVIRKEVLKRAKTKKEKKEMAVKKKAKKKAAKKKPAKKKVAKKKPATTKVAKKKTAKKKVAKKKTAKKKTAKKKK